MSWPDKLVDLLVVILGISIAFGIDNWAEGRKDARAKQQYLISLSSDLTKDSLRLQKNKTDLQALDAVLDTLFTVTYQQDIGKAELIASVSLKLGRGALFTPEDYTYQALQQTGDIGLFSNDSLQMALSRLHDIYETIESQQEIFRTIQFDYVIPFYFNYDERNKTIVDPEIYFQPKFINVLLAIGGNRSIRGTRNQEAINQLKMIQGMIRKELQE